MGKALGEKIKHYRKEKDYSQQQLADVLGVDRSTVTSWENDRRQPDAYTLSGIADALGVSLLFLIGLKELPDKPLNVILVDDEKIILKGGLLILKEALPDANITGFNKPSEAISYARENEISIAFLDINIGNSSGLDLCRELLAINPRTNVIFLTAHMEYSFDAWSTGACGFLLKPLCVEDIKEQLEKLRYPIEGGASL